MSEWDKARKILSDFIGECNCMTSEDYQKAFNAVEVGDRLQEENNKLKLFENLLREINNADMGINIEIETGLWTCDKCGTEFDESMYRYWVPMDWECLQEYKQDKQKLKAIKEINEELSEWRMQDYWNKTDAHSVLLQINDKMDELLGVGE